MTLKFNPITGQLDLVGSAAGGGGDVTKVGTPLDNQVGVWTGDGTIEGDTAFTYDKDLGHVEITGELHVANDAITTDTHTIGITTDAKGYGDVKSVDIDYITGAIATGQDEAVILVNVDESLATGGDVIGLEVL
jgi:hypothetical protein